MIKLALTDLDDTLIPFGTPGASDRAIAAIHAMIDAGLHFGPVTGRVPTAMGWMFRGDEDCVATGAFCNGQMVYIDGELTHTEVLDHDSLQHVQDVLEDVEGAALAVYDVTGDGLATLVKRNVKNLEGHPGVMGEVKRGGVGHGTMPSLGDTPWVKSNVHVDGTRERLVRVRDMLREECPKLDFVLPSPTAMLIDITPHGWNKAVGVRELARELGVGMDEVATFGDSENDLSMIEAVPNSVAVANATPDVAAAARWHIGPSRDDSVAVALEQIAAAAPTGGMPAFMH